MAGSFTHALKRWAAKRRKEAVSLAWLPAWFWVKTNVNYFKQKYEVSLCFTACRKTSKRTTRQSTRNTAGESVMEHFTKNSYETYCETTQLRLTTCSSAFTFSPNRAGDWSTESFTETGKTRRGNFPSLLLCISHDLVLIIFWKYFGTSITMLGIFHGAQTIHSSKDFLSMWRFWKYLN